MSHVFTHCGLTKKIRPCYFSLSGEPHRAGGDLPQEIESISFHTDMFTSILIIPLRGCWACQPWGNEKGTQAFTRVKTTWKLHLWPQSKAGNRITWISPVGESYTCCCIFNVPSLTHSFESKRARGNIVFKWCVNTMSDTFCYRKKETDLFHSPSVFWSERWKIYCSFVLSLVKSGSAFQ